MGQSCEDKLRAIEAYCREVDEFEDERGYDVRGIVGYILDIIHPGSKPHLT